jgi:hypothetical protein
MVEHAGSDAPRLLVARSIFYRGDVTARVAVRICRLAQYPVRATCGRTFARIRHVSIIARPKNSAQSRR